MSISYLGSERGSASLSLWVSLCRGMICMRRGVKGNAGDGWSSDGVVLWLERGQNGDAVEWWGE
jgi:hypothetical protein